MDKLVKKNHLDYNLEEKDQVIFDIINKDFYRQKNNLQLIASENFASLAVMQAQGSVLTNKYAEGYPKRRYYCGCEHVDTIEELAISRACELFKCKYANVQPHSGSQANQAVFSALLKPNDPIMGMSLNSGGHLTHGASPNLSGKWFNVAQYDVDKNTHLIDMEEVSKMAIKHRPKLIIAGGSAYSRIIDFKAFREIADEVGAYLLADIAHYSGLIASGLYPSPIQHAHIVTSTTHKTLRGPRGGIILTNDELIIKKINSAVFPGIQGGPFMHTIAAKAVAFSEALSDDFKQYSKNVIANAKTLANTLKSAGIDIVSNDTDCHMVLIDLRKQAIKGNVTVNSLERAGIITNKNSVPFDTEKPAITSGLRIGSSAETSRGLSQKEFIKIAEMMTGIIYEISKSGDTTNIEESIKQEVTDLCQSFPIYDF